MTSKVYKVLAIDLSGHGTDTTNPATVSFADYVNKVTDVTQGLNADHHWARVDRSRRSEDQYFQVRNLAIPLFLHAGEVGERVDGGVVKNTTFVLIIPATLPISTAHPGWFSTFISVA